MKISDTEINAANYQLTRYEEGRGNIQAVKEALEAAYTVRKQRRARKHAKRERQRKEKDKQVVESVKPADFVNPYDVLFSPNIGVAYDPLKEIMHIAASCGKYGVYGIAEPTPSKAPEWDGTFKAGEYQMRNGEKAIIDHIDGIHLCGKLSPDGLDCCFKWELSSGENNRVYAFDLIRPWPKGEQ